MWRSAIRADRRTAGRRSIQQRENARVTVDAIVRDLAIAPYGAANPGAVIAVSIATGKAVWRGIVDRTGGAQQPVQLDADALDPTLAVRALHVLGSDIDPNLGIAENCAAPSGFASSRSPL